MVRQLRSLVRLPDSYRALLINVGALVGTSGINAGLGFFYWVVATRYFSPVIVGISSAAISSMTLIGTIGMLGLGTVLMGLLPQLQQRRGVYLSTALVTVGALGIVIGVIFALSARWISPDLSVLGDQASNVLIFALGVGFTSVTLVLDQALLGMLWADLQLWRNVTFALVKLLLLFGIASVLGDQPMTIYFTWLCGNAVSLVVLALAIRFLRHRPLLHRPDFRVLKAIGWESLTHHSLNILLQAPGLLMPILVTALFSATVNGYFYIAWIFASLLFTVPFAFATILYASTAATPSLLSEKLQFTMGASLLIGGVGVVLLGLFGTTVISLFGHDYAQESSSIVFLLSFGVFGVTIKDSFVAVYRVRRQVKRALIFVGIGTVLEVLFPLIGAQFGLNGLIVGWLVALVVQSAIMWRPLVRALKRTPEPALATANQDSQAQVEPQT